MLAAIRLGQLSGHVRLTIGAQPSGDTLSAVVRVASTTTAPASTARAPSEASKAFRGEMKIYFDDMVEFDGNQQILTSAGNIYVRSDTVAFDAQGLTLAFNFNRDAQRVEYLRIDKGNRILLRNVGARALSLAEPENPAATRPRRGENAPRGTAAVPAGATAPTRATAATTSPAAIASTRPGRRPAAPPTVYKLSFGQDVRAAVGGSSLTSERLYLLFMAAGDMADGGKQGAETAPAERAVAQGGPLSPGGNAGAPPATRVADDLPGPMPPARENDLVVTWAGPMEMRPSGEQDLKLVNARDIALDAVGSPERPVEVRDPRAITRSGELWYHSEEHRIRLEPGSYGRVDIDMLEAPRSAVAARGGADGGRGAAVATRGGPAVARTRVVCQEVTIHQLDNRAELLGPGTIESKSRSGELSTVAWKESLDVELANVPDASKPGRTTTTIRRAVLHGAGIHNDNVDLTADLLDALFANADLRQPQLEHLLAKGHVAVDTLKREHVTLRPNAPHDGMRADQMEIFTAAGPAGKGPVPSRLVSTGNVSAWQYKVRASNQKKGAPGVKNEAPDPNDPANLQKSLISAGSLVVDLKQKPAAAGAAMAAATVNEGALGGFDQDFQPVHMLATDAVRVEITPPAVAAGRSGARSAQPIVALADVLDADPVAGSARLTMAGAADEVVRISMGSEDTIEGRIVNLAQHQEAGKSGGEIGIPVAGRFAFTLPPDSSRKEAMPLQVTWNESMSFDTETNLALFRGSPVARLSGDKEGMGQFSAEHLLKVQLKNSAPATRPATAPDTRPAGEGLLGMTGGLTLDYMEAGSPAVDGKATDRIDARGQQVADNGVKLTDMVLNTSHLIYHDATHRFEVPEPGTLAIHNYKPDKADARMSQQGDSAFKWEGSLVYDGNANTITFLKNVRFAFRPTKPLRLASGSLIGGGPTTMHEARVVDLRTQRLVATLTKAPGSKATKASASPIGLGNGGNQDLEKVVADEGADLDVGEFSLSGGKSLEYNQLANNVIVEGSADSRVTVVQPGEGIFSATQVFWDLTKDHNAFRAENVQGNIQLR
jgi:hypothetical protein